MKLFMAGVSLGGALIQILIFSGIGIKEPTLFGILWNIGLALFLIYKHHCK